MAHKEQQDFCYKVKALFPLRFYNKKVLDVGSLDINGSNKDLFEDCDYKGIDIGDGKNVDIVMPVHLYKGQNNWFDTIISTECFEHDMYYEKSLKNIIRMLKPGGLFLFTCATTGRVEHGTTRTSPNDSPLTAAKPGWMDYYKNLVKLDIENVVSIGSNFVSYAYEKNTKTHDLYFYGIKREENNYE